MKSFNNSFKLATQAILIQSFLFFLHIKIIAADLFVNSGQRIGETSGWSVSLADLDGDHDLDALVDGAIWLNDGTGIFTKTNQTNNTLQTI